VSPDRPLASVVIPTYNRRTRLHRVLDALARQVGGEGFETVVVSDGSVDGTNADLEQGCVALPVVACFQPNSGPSAARNRGVEAASGELIIFLDDDVVPEPGFVAAHISAHQRLGERAVVVGPMLTPSDHRMSPWIAYEQAMLAKQYDAMTRGDYHATARQFYTGNASLRREHVIAVGGFDTTLQRAEDLDLAYRLAAIGLQFHFEADAAGAHYADRSYESWRTIGRDYGRADVLFSRRSESDEFIVFLGKMYRRRSATVRALVRVAVGRPRISLTIERILATVGRGAASLGASNLSRAAMSGIFNLQYYEGVAEELGGRRQLRRAFDLVRVR
jgi:glycosyltransferase involved in cell wall biosynthesis